VRNTLSCLVLGFMATSNEPLEIGAWQSVWRQFINESTSCVNYKHGDDASV
jgi:hypothetical protein